MNDVRFDFEQFQRSIEGISKILNETFSKETFLQLLNVINIVMVTILHVLLTPISFNGRKGVHRNYNDNGVVSQYSVPLKVRYYHVGSHHIRNNNG